MRLYNRFKHYLVILDIMLHQRSGLDFCRAVRRDSTTPIIMISAKSEESDRVKGLELGADDYLVKPFSLSELTARVKAVLRRATGEPLPEIIDLDDLHIGVNMDSAAIPDRDVFVECLREGFDEVRKVA